MIMDFTSTNEGKILLRKIRNNIVGSLEYKKEYIRNGYLRKYKKCKLVSFLHLWNLILMNL